MAKEYKCAYCGEKVNGIAQVNRDKGLVFCFPEQGDKVEDIRRLDSMSHAYQYLMECGGGFLQNIPVSELEEVLGDGK